MIKCYYEIFVKTLDEALSFTAGLVVLGSIINIFGAVTLSSVVIGQFELKTTILGAVVVAPYMFLGFVVILMLPALFTSISYSLLIRLIGRRGKIRIVTRCIVASLTGLVISSIFYAFLIEDSIKNIYMVVHTITLTSPLVVVIMACKHVKR